MILAKLIIPDSLDEDVEKLYFRSDDYHLEQGRISVPKGGTLDFNTYFNSFPYNDYQKYTNVNEFMFSACISGQGSVELFCSTKEQSFSVGKVIVQNTEQTSYKLPVALSTLPKDGVLWLHLKAKENKITLWTGCLETTNLPESKVNLAIVMCTYHRERYILENTKRFLEILKQRELLLGEIKVYIIDNASELHLPETENLVVLPNKNYGGSGGFARGMFEAYLEKDFFTHVLLMDDDVSFEPESILRMISFLSLVKGEMPIFGGHMLLEEQPTLQFEGGGRYEKGRLQSLQHNVDVSLMDNLLNNQTNEKEPQYQAWWFCCIPMTAIEKNGFPNPFFIKTDDVEYGLRCGLPIVLMNGVAVWHKSFNNKGSVHLEYYIKRNELIVSALYDEGSGVYYSMVKLLRTSLKSIFVGDTRRMLYCKRAYLDFLKGTDFLKRIKADELNDTLLDEKNTKISRCLALFNFCSSFFYILISFMLHYRKVQKDYKDRRKELTSFVFWKEQLFP